MEIRRATPNGYYAALGVAQAESRKRPGGLRLRQRPDGTGPHLKIDEQVPRPIVALSDSAGLDPRPVSRSSRRSIFSAGIRARRDSGRRRSAACRLPLLCLCEWFTIRCAGGQRWIDPRIAAHPPPICVHYTGPTRPPFGCISRRPRGRVLVRACARDAPATALRHPLPPLLGR
jgi:hypothetical protein